MNIFSFFLLSVKFKIKWTSIRMVPKENTNSTIWSLAAYKEYWYMTVVDSTRLIFNSACDLSI